MNREWTIINALRVAARVYEDDANTMSAGGQLRVSQQFANQAKEAKQLADFIENVGLNPLGDA